MDTILTPVQYIIFIKLTSYLSILGGVIIWLGFILMAMVARRIERVYLVITYWQFQLIAPAGIFIYLLLQAVFGLLHKSLGILGSWASYILLVWSALLCAWGVLRFYKAIKLLVKEK